MDERAAPRPDRDPETGFPGAPARSAKNSGDLSGGDSGAGSGLGGWAGDGVGARVSPSLVRSFAELIYRRLGIRFSREKHEQLSIKLGKFARNRGSGSLKGLLEKIEGGDRATFDALVEAVTVNHTYFFREAEHFPLLEEDIRRRKLDKPLIWCAASSSGEEPYSLAMHLLQRGIEDFRILASDIDRDALRTMHRGAYKADQVETLSPYQRAHYFSKAEDGKYRVDPKLRRRLVIKRLNLVDDFELPAKVDHIFCRNALIYFDEQSRHRVIGSLVSALAPQGLLFLGHTETLLDCPRELEREAHSTFRKR